jgi:hypothetical protein
MVCGITENGIGDLVIFGTMDPIVASLLVHLEFNGTMRAAKNVTQDGSRMTVRIIKELPLYTKGVIQLGWKQYDGGMTAGVEPMYCRLLIPEDCGLYPDIWFPLTRMKGQTKLIKSIEESGGFVPQEVLLDCYSHAWETLYRSSK